MENKHLFAIYSDISFSVQPGEVVRLPSETLWLRIAKVLRLQVGERLIVFNEELHIELELTDTTFLGKNVVCGVVITVNKNSLECPSITLLQGITKKAAFEEILYNAAQLGIKTIIPVKTAKSRSGEFSFKEKSRFTSIMIAACEQAKQFVVPQLAMPITLESVLETTKFATTKIVFDDTGDSFVNIISTCVVSNEVVALFGPEGGLIEKELFLVTQNGFNKIRLTQAILRSEDAPLLGIGMIRSFIA